MPKMKIQLRKITFAEWNFDIGDYINHKKFIKLLEQCVRSIFTDKNNKVGIDASISVDEKGAYLFVAPPDTDSFHASISLRTLVIDAINFGFDDAESPMTMAKEFELYAKMLRNRAKQIDSYWDNKNA